MTTAEALFYYRISEDKTGERLGVDRQEPPCLALCDHLGFTRGKSYVDNDISATKGLVRPAFEQLLIDVRRDPRPIIVWHTDRLVRLSSELLRVIETGVSVHAVEAGHFDLSTPAGRAVAKTLTAWAEYEGEQKALRQVAAARQKAEQGRPSWSTRPFGYERDGRLREFEAVMVRRAYAVILGGGSLASITRRFNASGHLTERGNRWTTKTIRLHLLNPRNIGISTYRGREMGKGRWESLVSEETFRAACRIITSSSRASAGGGARTNLLSGLLKCSVCQSVSRVQWVGGKPDGYAVYTCRGHQHFTTRVLQADAYVTGQIVAWLESDDGQAVWAVEGNADEMELLGDERIALNNRVSELVEMWTTGELPRPQFVSINRGLQERLAGVEGTLAKAGLARAVGGALMTPERVVAEWASDDFGLEKRRIVIEMAVEILEAKPRGKGARGFDGDRDLVVRFYDVRT